MCRSDGYIEDAVRAYRRFLEHYDSTPLRIQALYNCGRLLLDLGRTTEAEEVFQELFNRYPDRTETLWSRYYLAYRKLEDGKNPAPIIEEFLLIEKENIPGNLLYEIRLLLGDAYVRLGDAGHAQWYYRACFDRVNDRNRIQVIFSRLARLDYFTGNGSSFDEYSLKAIEGNPGIEHVNDILELRLFALEVGLDSPEFLRLGSYEFLMAQRLFSTASDSLTGFLSGFPSPAARYHAGMILGKCLVHEGRYKEALNAYRQVIEGAGPGIVQDHALMAVAGVYERYLEDPRKAVIQYEELLKISQRSIFAGKARRRIEHIIGGL